MQILELINAIKKFSFAECLQESEIIELLKVSEINTFKKGSVIFEPIKNLHHIYLLLDGVVKVIAKVDEDREVINMIVNDNAILNEQTILNDDPIDKVSVVISNTAIILKIQASSLREFMVKNPQMAIKLMDIISKKLKQTEDRLESLLSHDARKRVINFLKTNASSIGTSVGSETLIRHDFTQQDIANFTGTSRQTVTTILNDLKKSNKIYFKRKSILIRDLAKLV